MADLETLRAAPADAVARIEIALREETTLERQYANHRD
jgi:hypothetical protein